MNKKLIITLLFISVILFCCGHYNTTIGPDNIQFVDRAIDTGFMIYSIPSTKTILLIKENVVITSQDNGKTFIVIWKK
jgi:hypothetical protein